MKIVNLPILLIIALVGLSACAHNPRSQAHSVAPWAESNILTLYDQLRDGMSKEEAEAILGKHILGPMRQANGDVEFWYVEESERQMAREESPWGPAGIVVMYRDEKVFSYRYNHQYVKGTHQELYEQRASTEAPASEPDSK